MISLISKNGQDSPNVTSSEIVLSKLNDISIEMEDDKGVRLYVDGRLILFEKSSKNYCKITIDNRS